MNKKRIKEIRKELQALNEYEVVIFGSYNSTYFNERSDIDIAIITRESNPKRNRKRLFDLFAFQKPPYEFHVFELLPLHVKMEIVNNFKVIWGDKKKLSEYFFYFRKLWKDQEWRYKENIHLAVNEKVKDK